MKRRHVLTLCASLASLAGCASIADDFSNSSPRITTEERSTTASTTPSVTSTADTATEEATTTASQTGTSVDDFPIKTPDNPVTNTSVPSETSSATYATMGRADADVSATLYGNWKCPHTREFVLTDFNDIVSNYVEQGTLTVRFRSIAYKGERGFLGSDAPRATRAGLAVWNHSPSDYWTYFATVFASQPQERFVWATAHQLDRLVDAVGVTHSDEIRTEIESDAYSQAIHQTVEDANEVGVSNVPRLVVDGTVTNPGVDFDHTVSVIERAIHTEE